MQMSCSLIIFTVQLIIRRVGEWQLLKPLRDICQSDGERLQSAKRILKIQRVRVAIYSSKLHHLQFCDILCMQYLIRLFKSQRNAFSRDLTCLPLNSIWKFLALSWVTLPPKSSWYTWLDSFHMGALFCITNCASRLIVSGFEPEIPAPLCLSCK